MKTELVKNFLFTECGVKYTHLNVVTPPEEKLKAKDPNWLKPRGVHQRNEGLHWLRQHLRNQRSHSGSRLIYRLMALYDTPFPSSAKLEYI